MNSCPNPRFPRSTWLGNSAGYGPVTATIAYNLSLVTPALLGGYRSNDPLRVVVEMRDYHGQLITGGSGVRFGCELDAEG